MRWPGGPEDLSPVWEVERGMGHAAPVIAAGYLVFIHGMDGKEIVECLHPENGKRYWVHETEVTFKHSYGVADSPRASPT